MTKPVDLTSRDRSRIWHPYTQMLTAPAPLPIARGEGAYLNLEDGRRLLDGISSWWVNIHGHSHPALNAALTAQAAELEHVVFAGCTHPPAVELAERLLAVLPKGLTRVFYSDNGSTAVEVALKLACQYWQNRGEPSRRSFVALHHAYHGDTVGAMSASEDSVFTRPFTTLLFDAKPGDRIHCLGPLGRPFAPVAAPDEAWLVAGGVGLAPFATLADVLRRRKIRTRLYYGARRAAELFYLDLFEKMDVELVLATEDGSRGERGRVTVPLERDLKARPASAGVMLYACGPEAMLAAVARLSAAYGRPAQVSVERVMGCGVGGCYSCVIPVNTPEEKPHFVRSCLAGPVFRANDIVW